MSVFVLYDGFREERTFTGMTAIAEVMRTIASYMVEHNIKKGIVYQLIKGNTSGKGWKIWRTEETYYYQVNNSMRPYQVIGKLGELAYAG